MILHGFFHDFNLLGSEPALQSGISLEDFATGEVVDGARTAHSQVVVGGNDINHVDVGTCYRYEFQGVFDDTGYVAQSVALAKFCIFGQNLCFHKLHDFEIYLLLHTFSSFIYIMYVRTLYNYYS